MLRYGQEVILLAQSDKFGQIVSDIIGTLGLRDAEEATGISAAYIGAMKRGHIPAEAIIAKFAAGFGTDANQLFDAAREVKADIQPELIIQAGCEAANLSTDDRLHILREFRSAQDNQKKKNVYKKSAAA